MLCLYGQITGELSGLRSMTLDAEGAVRDRPVIEPCEMELPPEVVEAGADELDAFTAQDLLQGFISRHTVAESVFRAMLRAAYAMPPGRRAPWLCR